MVARLPPGPLSAMNGPLAPNGLPGRNKPTSQTAPAPGMPVAMTVAWAPCAQCAPPSSDSAAVCCPGSVGAGLHAQPPNTTLAVINVVNAPPPLPLPLRLCRAFSRKTFIRTLPVASLTRSR